MVRPHCRQSGYILWSLLVLLAVMTELAISSLLLAAHEGLSVRASEQRFQQQQWLELMAQQLAQMPVPLRRSADRQQLWHPFQQAASQGCGRLEKAQLTQASMGCGELHQPLLATASRRAGWQWRLTLLSQPVVVQEGSDVAAFPMLQAQIWQLEVMTTGRSGASPRGLWRRYQQVSP